MNNCVTSISIGNCCVVCSQSETSVLVAVHRLQKSPVVYAAISQRFPAIDEKGKDLPLIDILSMTEGTEMHS